MQTLFCITCFFKNCFLLLNACCYVSCKLQLNLILFHNIIQNRILLNQ